MNSLQVNPAGTELDEVDPRDPPRSLARRIAVRIATIVIIGAVGIGLCIAGGLLTITVIGAPVGLPLMLAGFLTSLFAVVLLLGKRVQTFFAGPAAPNSSAI